MKILEIDQLATSGFFMSFATILRHFDKGAHRQQTSGKPTQFWPTMRNCFATFLLLCQIFLSSQKPLTRRAKRKEMRESDISSPEASLQIRHDFLENKINTLVLESMIVDSLLENQNSNRNTRSLKRRKHQLRRSVSTNDHDHYLSRPRQYRRRGNRGDLVPFPRVGWIWPRWQTFAKKGFETFITTL